MRTIRKLIEIKLKLKLDKDKNKSKIMKIWIIIIWECKGIELLPQTLTF